MIAIRLLTRDEVIRKLAPYGCRLVAELDVGSEIWETAWKEPFSLMPEPDGRYDEWQIREVIAETIAITMPFNGDDDAGK